MDLRKLDHLAGTPPKEIKQSVENRKAEAPFVLLDADDSDDDPVGRIPYRQSSWQNQVLRAEIASGAIYPTCKSKKNEINKKNKFGVTALFHFTYFC